MDSSKKKKVIIFCMASLVFVVCCVFVWVFAYSQNGAGHFFPMNVLVGKCGLSEKNSITLSKGDAVEFSFVSFDSFKDLSLFIKSQNAAQVDVVLLNGVWEQLGNSKITIDAGTNGFVPVFSYLDTHSERESYLLRVSVTDGDNIIVASYNGGTAIKATDGFPFVVVLYILINGLIWLSAAGFLYTYVFKNYRLSKVFIVVVVPLIIVFSILLYPGTVCDENTHFTQAYRVANRIMGLSQHLMRAEDISLVSSRWAVPNIEGVYMAFTQFGHRTINTNLVEYTGEGHAGKDVVYLLPAFGIIVGRSMGLNVFTTYYLGRFFNILLYLVTGFLTLHIATFGKEILFLFLVLPLTLNQCISVNQDCICFCVSFLAIAFWTRWKSKMIIKREKVQINEICAIFFLGLLLLCCKAYVMVMAVYITLPWRKVYKLEKKHYIVVGCLLLAFCVALAFVLSGSTGYAKYIQNALLGKSNGSVYSLRYFLERPSEGIKVYWTTITEQLFSWFWDAFGSRLSWETFFSPVFAVIFFVIIFLEAYAEGGILEHSNGVERLVIVLTELVYFIIVYLRACSWTIIGRSTIWGIQGRYFIPFLPLWFFIIIGKKKRRFTEEHKRYGLIVFAGVLLLLVSRLLNGHILVYLVE